MFRHITNIRSFGIFSDFSGGQLPDFAPFNLIYGWNYSGKTTLSRVFRSIEKGAVHPDFANGKFSFLGMDGTVFDDRFATSCKVRVYNEDFRKEHLLWDEREGFYPILLLGADNIELWEALEQKTQSRLDIEAKKEEVEDELSQKKRVIDQAETDCAGRIANDLPVGRFDRRHLRPIISSWGAKLPDPLPSDQVQQSHVKVTAEQKEPLALYSVNVVRIEELWLGAASLLQERILTTAPIPYLIENPKIAQWVSAGRELHVGKDKCEFCENDLSLDRLEALDAHFSNAFDEMKARLNAAVVTLEDEKVADPASGYPKASFYLDLQDLYDPSFSAFSEERNKFNSALSVMIDALRSKLENPFLIVPLPCDKPEVEELERSARPVQDLIQANNERTEKFSEEREKAIEVLKGHYASEEMRRIDRYAIERRISELDQEREACLTKLRSLDDEISSIQAELSKAVRGAEAVNENLRKFFGKADIQVKVTEGDRFLLMRGATPAKNLSEGEKTAISFCYFMTKLMEDGQDLGELVIYIDDPMSSLDANHLLHLTAFIKNSFYKRNSTQTKHECIAKQIFISTHSYEFFHLTLDWMAKMNNSMYKTWMVKRTDTVDGSNAKLIECPESITKYRSEYLFLFHKLCDFIDSP